ncbi:MAG: DUF488 domain-containing protein, partial [Bdellovibrionota bacterium]
NHSWEKFQKLLQDAGIKLLVDVRSHPVSRFTPHFSKKNLEEALAKAGIRYEFLGAELGGRPKEKSFYKSEKEVDYWKLAGSKLFKDGIERLLELAKESTTTIMCAEEDPNRCHRGFLITPALHQKKIEVRHLRGDGRTQEKLSLDRQMGLL